MGGLHGDQSWFPGFRAHTRILSNPFLSLVALVLSTLIALCNTCRTSQHSNLLNEQLLFITKCDRVVLQSVTAPVFTKCDKVVLQSATAILLQVGQVLLQSATGITKCCKCYYKVRQGGITECDSYFITSGTSVITKCDRCYKVLQVYSFVFL